MASPWAFSGESAGIGAGDHVTLVDGATFMVSGRTGDVDARGAQGLFVLDTRVVSSWTVRVAGRHVEPLSVTPNGPFSATFVGRVHVGDTIDAPVVVVQRRWVGRGMREDLEIRNYADTALELAIELTVGADFQSLFDVKAGHVVPTPAGSHRATANGVRIDSPVHDGLRSPVHATMVESELPPDVCADSDLADSACLRWTVQLAPGAAWRTCLQAVVCTSDGEIEPSHPCGSFIEEAVPVRRLRRWRESTARVDTNHRGLARAVDRSIEDLGSLRIFDPAHTDRVVVAAGAPWFMTLFGRDSLLTSWMALLVDHELARGVLAELAENQGTDVDPRSEEQPGRIMHEVRFDRLSAAVLGRGGTYYGTADATPLFVMLVAELARWSGPTADIAALLPAVDRALDWIDRFGDRDGDGFVEYLRSDPSGLEHQGWKDSWDGVRHLDGAVAVPPIALCEVQGYVYAAYRGRAALARAFGESDAVARDFDERAELLQQRFDATYWLADHGWYAIGLDHAKRPIASLTSNIGHLLWSGIVPDDRAHAVAEVLTSAPMFSGWGLRTLSADTNGYNPLSYHCGSVWPHDTALAVAGLSRYGHHDAAQRLAMALIDASAHTGGRLPELFGGFDRADLPAPVPYPASCVPQAWSAASSLLIVRALLGLEPDLLDGRVALRPRLPVGIDELAVVNIPLGRHRLDVRVQGDHVDVDLDGRRLELRAAADAPAEQISTRDDDHAITVSVT